MYIKKRLYWFYRRQRARYYRYKRLLFASPAEMALIRLMGGSFIEIGFIKNKNGFPFTIVTSIGRWFGREHMRREVRVGKCFIDFGNDIQRGIEVLGAQWHKDIVKEQERDEYLKKHGWQILYINAADIFNNPDAVQRRVIKFLIH